MKIVRKWPTSWVDMETRKQSNWTRLFNSALLVFLFLFLLDAFLGGTHHRPTKITRAVIEVQDLANAIRAYEQDYDHLPLADVSSNADITLGFDSAEIEGLNFIKGTRIVLKNSDALIILSDLDVGVNAGHKLNPRQIKYISPKLVEGIEPGFSMKDYQYRDPWGNPYVISLDADRNGLTRDAFYANTNLFTNAVASPLILTNGGYEFPGKVMIWSRGPDGKASSIIPANAGVNQDNIESWQ